jgi:hypothetical protein
VTPSSALTAPNDFVALDTERTFMPAHYDGAGRMDGRYRRVADRHRRMARALVWKDEWANAPCPSAVS